MTVESWRIDRDTPTSPGTYGVVQFDEGQPYKHVGVLEAVVPNGSAAIAALRTDVWQEDKKGLRPFDGLVAHASWLTIDKRGDVVGWDITRAVRIVIEAALTEENNS